MSGITRAAAKTTEAKKDNSVSQQRKTEPPQPMRSPADQIKFLQRTIGNQRVQGLLRSGALQARLKISTPGDRYEQEADRVAERVMRMPEPAVQPKRSCPFTKGSLCKEKEEILQTSKVGGEMTQSSPAMESQINSLKGGGQPLPESVNAFFEPRFGTDFSHVRVHSGAAAEQSARDVNANAYVVGHDIVFGSGQFAPDTQDGRRLIAHELTHVLQQGGGSSQLQRDVDQAALDQCIAEQGGRGYRDGGVASSEELERYRQECLARNRGSVQPDEEGGLLSTVAGGLAGEFNEDPSLAMIGVDLGVSLIPILDQASDTRDITAHLYFMTVRAQYDRFMRWIGLVFSLIGLFPEVGSAIKGASKFIIKGVREVLTHLGELLRPLRRILPEIADVGRFQAYITRNWSKFVAFGTLAWNEVLNRVTRIFGAVSTFAGRLVMQIRDALARIREISPSKLASAFVWVRRQFDDVLNQVRERLGLRERLGPPPAGATETRLSQTEYEAALTHVFPSQYFNRITQTIDGVGQRAAQDAVADSRFVQAVQNGNWALAGTLFHSAAARQVRALPASSLPVGWTVQAENVIQAGVGGSRVDVLLRGPAGDILEFDWKTTGRSALSTGSRQEMTRHAGQIVANIGGTLVTQESRSWIDFVRPLMPGIAWP